jgi:hypothetical protein
MFVNKEYLILEILEKLLCKKQLLKKSKMLYIEWLMSFHKRSSHCHPKTLFRILIFNIFFTLKAALFTRRSVFSDI